MDKATAVAMIREATHEPYQLGVYFESHLIPPVPEHCVFLAAGPLNFVVEYRQLTDELVADTTQTEQDANAENQLFDDFGATLHVLGLSDGLEHLRFDCFENKPHYHYVKQKEGANLTCRIDQYAEGDPIQWTLGRVRERLPEMLEMAGVDELAAQTREQRTEVLAVVDQLAVLLEKARVRAHSERPS